MPTPLWSYTLSPIEEVSIDPTAPPIEAIALQDLRIDSSGDLADPIELVTGADAVVQRLWIRFHFWLGAWFLDQRLGIPWIEQIYVKAPNENLVTSILRRVVAECAGVASVKRFVCTFDYPARRLSVEFETVLTTRQILTVAPFILSAAPRKAA